MIHRFHKILIGIFLVLITLAILAGVMILFRQNSAVSKIFKDAKFISGQVIKIEPNAIFFKVRSVKLASGKSAETDDVVNDEKAALIRENTEFVTFDSVSGDFKKISRDQIRVGSKISVRYDNDFDLKAFDAKIVILNEI